MKKISIILLLFIGFTSCKKFNDVNLSPNNPPSAPAFTILPSTTVGLAFANSNDLDRVTSLLVQHITGTGNQSASYDAYFLDGSFDNQWNSEIYGNTLQNLQILIDSNASTNPAYSGIAKIQMAYVFSIATDLWGEVPYSQAAKGVKFLYPRFDKQEDIYQGNPALGITSLFDLVKSGIDDLGKPSPLTPAGDDLVYKGDLTKWAKAGNSLLLKFAIQISNRNPNLATTIIQGVINGNKYIDNNSLDFEVPFGASTGNQNPLYTFNYINRPADQALSNTLLGIEKNLNDTVRLAKYFTKPGNKFVGFDNSNPAISQAVADPKNRSRYNTYLTGVNGEAPIRILTNFQTQFNLAEAAVILKTSGDANTYYQAGIKSNMQKIGMTDAEIADYFAKNPSVVTLKGTDEQKRQQIITQKYIAWIGNGIEAYNDFRRTGYPTLSPVPFAGGDNPAVIPTRLPYTPAELSTNPNAPKPRPKTDVKLWFAK